MKKLTLIIFVLILPIILLEIFLRFDNNLYQEILKSNYDFSEWQEASPIINNWKNILVMGTSIAKQDINPKIIEEQFKLNNLNQTVGTIAINADSTVNDYLTLSRILATCTKCPNTIIYQVTDESLKYSEIKAWKENTLRRILKLYYIDINFESLLNQSARLDPYFSEYNRDLKMYSQFRVYFTKQRLISLIENNIYKNIGLSNNDNYEPNYADPNLVNDGNGFYSYPESMDHNKLLESLAHNKDVLSDYKIGGATEFFFLKFIELAKLKHIKLYFVLAPLNKNHINNFKDTDNYFKNYVLSVAVKKNIEVFNNMNFSSGNNKLFHDLNHLNAVGANIYSKYLSQELVKVIKK